jgi:hypothetical protein
LAEEQARARFAGPTPGPGPSRVFYRILLQLVQEVRPSIFPVPGALQLTAAVSLRQLLSTLVPAARGLQHLHRFNVGGEPGNNIRSRHSLENAYDHKYD